MSLCGVSLTVLEENVEVVISLIVFSIIKECFLCIKLSFSYIFIVFLCCAVLFSVHHVLKSRYFRLLLSLSYNGLSIEEFVVYLDFTKGSFFAECLNFNLTVFKLICFLSDSPLLSIRLFSLAPVLIVTKQVQFYYFFVL